MSIWMIEYDPNDPDGVPLILEDYGYFKTLEAAEMKCSELNGHADRRYAEYVERFKANLKARQAEYEIRLQQHQEVQASNVSEEVKKKFPAPRMPQDLEPLTFDRWMSYNSIGIHQPLEVKEAA